MQTLVLGQVILFLLFWVMGTSAIIPKPLEVLVSLRDLWSQGLAIELYTSVKLYAEAIVCATAFSLALTYLSVIPFFLPLATMWGKLRFLGMVGLPFLFTMYISGAHELKLALLSFSASVFLVVGMADVIDNIPSEKFDLARTLRMGEWQVVWEVIVLGRADVMFDVVRQNAAIAWMMLSVAEGLWKSEGGIGALLDIQNKHFHLSEIAAIQIVILGIGLSQDYFLGVLKSLCCPYASLLLQRR